jgi:hypothetical protein
MLFNGLEVFVSNFLPEFERKQFRFPRSKKRRIQKKWSKMARYYRNVELPPTYYLINGNKLVCNKRAYQILLEEIK